MPSLVMGMKNTQRRINHLIGACEVRSWVEVRRGRDWNFWGLRQNKQASYLDSDEVPPGESMAVESVPLHWSTTARCLSPYTASRFLRPPCVLPLFQFRTCGGSHLVRKSTCSQRRSTSFSSNARQSPKRVWACQGPNHLNVTHLARRPGTARRRLHIPLPPPPGHAPDGTPTGGLLC
jgi:hypothetical protein